MIKVSTVHDSPMAVTMTTRPALSSEEMMNLSLRSSSDIDHECLRPFLEVSRSYKNRTSKLLKCIGSPNSDGGIICNVYCEVDGKIRSTEEVTEIKDCAI